MTHFRIFIGESGWLFREDTQEPFICQMDSANRPTLDLPPEQREGLRRLALCWNILHGLSTADLERIAALPDLHHRAQCFAWLAKEKRSPK